MSLRSLFGSILVAFSLMVSPPALAAGPYPPPADEYGEVSDTRVEAGACVTFSGGGFQPGTQVEITDNGEFVATATVNDRGEFSQEVCFGASAGRGEHTLAAVGLGADGSVLRVTATVFVTGVSQRSGSGSGPVRGTGAGGNDGDGPGIPGTPISSPTSGVGGSDSPQSTTGPGEPSAPGPHNRPQTSRESSGLGLAGWLLVFAIFGFLALLSSLVLLAGRRRRGDDAAASL